MRIPTLALLCLITTSLQGQFISEKLFTVQGATLDKTFLAKGDFNHDAKLDVLFSATTTSSQHELVVFPGNGAGGFGAPIITPITNLNDVKIGIAGDFNGDGVPDVVISGTDPVQGIAEIGVMVAESNGKFKSPVFTRGSVNGVLALGDFTGDKKVDLAMVAVGAIFVLPGNGDGTFGSLIISSGSGTCVAVADFNKDGNMDLTTGREVYLGNGDGTFQSPIEVGGGCDVAVADFNKDGIPDLITGAQNSYPYQPKVFLGDGTGKFRQSAIIPLYYGSGYAGGRGLTVARFNRDNNFDVAIFNPTYYGVTMLLGNGDGTFTVGETYLTDRSGLLSGDFNGDGLIDLAVQNSSGFSLLLGQGDGTLKAQSSQPGLLGASIRLADVNGDGKTDLVEFGTAPSAVLLGNGDGTFGSPISMPCYASTGIVADFNGDKKPDIIVAPGDGVEICLGNGDGTFRPGVVFDSGVGHSQVLAGDFNHDGKLDLAASDVGGVSILLGNGDGTFQGAIPSGAANFQNLVTGDFNHDGKLDIAANYNGVITVLLGNGDGTFHAPITSSNPNGSGFVAAGDLNGDGNLDLVTTAGVVGGGLNILLGNGNGTFKAPVLLKVPGASSASALQLRDLNLDHTLDIVLAGGGFLDVILGKGDGTFQPIQSFPAPPGVPSLAAANINGDNLLDVAILSRLPKAKFGTLTVYLNQGH